MHVAMGRGVGPIAFRVKRLDRRSSDSDSSPRSRRSCQSPGNQQDAWRSSPPRAGSIDWPEKVLVCEIAPCSSAGSMSVLRCLITAGPTREHLDPIRYLSNGSSGKMGYALAHAAAGHGWQVDLVSGPVSLAPPPGVQTKQVVSAEQMFHACDQLFDSCDLFIAVAAVADFRPARQSAVKMKKSEASLQLELEPTIDILKTLAARKTSRQIVVGFAAETHDLETYAQKKLTEKNLDWIVANDVSRAGIGMNSDDNAVVMLSRAGVRIEFGPAPKADVAERILRTIVESRQR